MVAHTGENLISRKLDLTELTHLAFTSHITSFSSLSLTNGPYCLTDCCVVLVNSALRDGSGGVATHNMQ